MALQSVYILHKAGDCMHTPRRNTELNCVPTPISCPSLLYSERHSEFHETASEASIESRDASHKQKKSWQDGYGLQNGSISSFALNRSITIELPEWIGNNSSVLYSEVGQKEKYTESRKNNKPVCYF